MHNTCRKPSYVHFDVHIGLVQYTSLSLFVDFHCSDSKVSCIVSLHIQNIVIKMQFDGVLNVIHECLIKFETFLTSLSSQTCGLYISNEFALNWLNSYLKSVKFLFSFSIYKPLFKHACTAIQWTKMSRVLSEPLSI